MEGNDTAEQQVRALKQRISALSTAIIRISGSLDIETVLQEAVDSARVLAGARYGVIATVDDTGDGREFVSSGFTADERRQLAEWPEGPQLFAHLCEQPGTLRLDDVPGYLSALGLTPELFMRSKTLQATPMRHRGQHVGHFFLGEKEEGAEFTHEDEEVLVLFASQAAAAIANARTYHDEQRARADLEALVDTSPVGVVVFNARTGDPMTFNPEARRIVQGPGVPDQPIEHSLKAVTCRFADGRELTLEDSAISTTFVNATAMRAEEVVLSMPDGRSVKTLVNATPSHSHDGTVDSVVVTLQDLAPLEELERQRARFLRMVSHELWAPLTSIKGSATVVLDAMPELPRAELLQFFRMVDAQADHMQSLIWNLLDAGLIEAGTLSVNPEPSAVSTLVDRAHNTFLSGGSLHTVHIDLPPDLPRVLADRERIVQVLNILLSNAARRSPVSAPIRVEAARDSSHVAVSVRDEGQGISQEKLRQLFRKQVALAGSNGEGGTGASGLGLLICKGLVEAHGGRIRAESAGLGQGARFIFTLPVLETEDAGAAAQQDRARSGQHADGRGRTRVLVVDDDPHTRRYVRNALSEAGYSVLVTAKPAEISDLIRSERPRLVLLDLMLPGSDGIELMTELPELADLPIIFISGYGRDETIARAFESGAADYIVKPFSPTELVARVRVALRNRARTEPFVLGALTIDYELRQVAVDGQSVTLTATEYELLRTLSVSAGRVVTSKSLLRQIWGLHDTDDTERVRSFVRNLRAKLGDNAAKPAWIFNERGVGYCMPSAEGP